MSEIEFKQLEARVKSLEDLLAEVTRVILGAPKEVPKQTEKDYFKTASLIWVEQPPTPKGVWESTTQISNPDAQEIIKALESAGKPLFSKEPNALYWLLKDRETGKITGIGRRKK